jgi:glycogen debranching enzyme
MAGMLTILEGSTFCICDDRGDIVEETNGFFAFDTRFLSRLVLRIDSSRPLLLSSGRVHHFSAAFFLRNGNSDGVPHDALSIARERFVGTTGMQERVAVRNVSMQRLEFALSMELEADFADIITVKNHDFALGDPAHAAPLPPCAPWRHDGGPDRILIEDPAGDLRTQIVLSRPGEMDGDCVSFPVALDPHEVWELTVDVVPVLGEQKVAESDTTERLEGERETLGDVVAVWTLRVPKVRGGWESLRRAFDRSVVDLGALRMRAGPDRRPLFAAGMPWFMTVFGRDTAITSLQTLLLGPELAVGALEALAELQALEDDPSIDAEPGKILHELRRGRAADTWFARYYGSVDSTPLFLILLAETWRWTDDATLAQRLREPALRALEWIDRSGDADGDGFVEYQRRADNGLLNQSWKDSGDSQRFHDGRLARSPIAPVEVQGYVYDAKRGLAEIAREVWRDRSLAERLDMEADELRRRFDETFWVEERGGFYALALDAEKKQVDARTSNMGHLLWSGIVPHERVGVVVDQLLSERLWSGWGVRTMATDDLAFSPLSYHNGTVWPHDTALTVWGLVRYGHMEAARRIARGLFEAADHFDWSLPEVFAGYAREETPFPIAYPTAARPQAWAAGTPILLLRLLLGLEPDRARQRLATVVEDELPSWLDGLRVEGIRAFGRSWIVAVERGGVAVSEGA